MKRIKEFAVFVLWVLLLISLGANLRWPAHKRLLENQVAELTKQVANPKIIYKEVPSEPIIKTEYIEVEVEKAPPEEISYLAPEGVYYVLTSFTLNTENGVQGFQVGEKVFRKRNGFMRANSPGEVSQIEESHLTNDLRKVAQMASRMAEANVILTDRKRSLEARALIKQQETGKLRDEMRAKVREELLQKEFQDLKKK